MLSIRLQRVGHTGHAMYRIIVQESQRQPTSGRVIAFVGTYDPHTKDCKIQVEPSQKFLDAGAQPSPRVVKLLKAAGVKLPSWVEKASTTKTKIIRHAEKLRKNQPKVEAVKEVKTSVKTEEVESTEAVETVEE